MRKCGNRKQRNRDGPPFVQTCFFGIFRLKCSHNTDLQIITNKKSYKIFQKLYGIFREFNKKQSCLRRFWHVFQLLAGSGFCRFRFSLLRFLFPASVLRRTPPPGARACRTRPRHRPVPSGGRGHGAPRRYAPGIPFKRPAAAGLHKRIPSLPGTARSVDSARRLPVVGAWHRPPPDAERRRHPIVSPGHQHGGWRHAPASTR